MDIKIFQISAQSPILDQVIKLGDKYSNFLGFYPQEAFIEDAKHKRIIVASIDGVCVGYLLFRIAKTKNRAAITHLCVDEKFRGMDVGRRLVDYLISITKDWLGISLYCRRDYASTGFWEHMGFTYKSEKMGRGKDRIQLIQYWYDHHHPTLFSHALETAILEKTFLAIIDMNIFIDLYKNPTHPLRADWLMDDLVISVTEEVVNEINRNNDKEKRLKMVEYYYSFQPLTVDREEINSIYKKIINLYKLPLSIQDKSDLLQISSAIGAGADFFVTRDKKLKNRLKNLEIDYGISIISDDDLIIHFDNLQNQASYQANRFSGSLIQISRITSGEADKSANTFHDVQFEKKANFRKKLSDFLSDPKSYECLIISSPSKQPLALIVYSEIDPNVLEIPIIRTKDGPLSPDLDSQLIFWSVSKAVEKNIKVIKITDKYLTKNTILALKENSFINISSEWIKINLMGMLSIDQVKDTLQLEKNRYKEVDTVIDLLLKEILGEEAFESNESVLNLENKLWPLKVLSPKVETYLIPIQASWASDLFDYKLGNQTLYGSDPNLVLKMENVYYRSAKSKIPKAPSRVLWYVSRGSSKNYQDTMAIRACSYVEDVVIGTPKSLFKKFEKLGVFKWQNVLKAAKGSISKELLSFRFSRTELFDRSISLQKYMFLSGNKCAPQTAQKIDNELFYKIYQIGSSTLRT